MAPRALFALVFFDDLRAAEIFRDDQFKEPSKLHPTKDIGLSCEVLYQEKSNFPFMPISGKILQIGTKKYLSTLRVSKEGTLVDAKDKCSEHQLALSRRKSKLLLEQQQAHAREFQLQGLNETLTEEGPASLPAIPFTVHKRNNSKQHPPEALQNLQTLLDQLPCYTQGPCDVEIAKGLKIYIPAFKLHMLDMYYATNPVRMFREIIRILVPQNILSMPGLSQGGNKGHVAIPKDIVSVAHAYTTKNSTGKQFDVRTTLRNLLYDAQNHSTSSVDQEHLSTETSVGNKLHCSNEFIQESSDTQASTDSGFTSDYATENDALNNPFAEVVQGPSFFQL